jgi:uncharacterized protein (TIGR03086 family)
MAIETDLSKDADPGLLLSAVLADLADLVVGIRPDQLGEPTPCSEFDVAQLRTHVLAWVTYFATVLQDPDQKQERPDPNVFVAPDDPAEAAEIIRTAAREIATAVDGGVADRPVTLMGSPMPGSVILGMTLGEYLVHGSDLAKATGQSWNPPAAALLFTLEFMPGMLTDDYRGEGQSFGPRVPVAPDAAPLDQLLGFCGRNPAWTA